MCVQSQALKHLIMSTFPLNGAEREMAFVTVHYDDSGTDPNQKIAIAACYLASPEQWTEFSRNWQEVDQQEHFGVFHMAEFAANQKDSPFESWDEEKKKRACSVSYAMLLPLGQRLVLRRQYPSKITMK